MKKKHGDGHPEYHVEEFVEEEAEERSEDLSEGKENPVIEVANVILLVSAFQSEEGKIGRHQVAHQTGQ